MYLESPKQHINLLFLQIINLDRLLQLLLKSVLRKHFLWMRKYGYEQ